MLRKRCERKPWEVADTALGFIKGFV